MVINRSSCALYFPRFSAPLLSVAKFCPWLGSSGESFSSKTSMGLRQTAENSNLGLDVTNVLRLLVCFEALSFQTLAFSIGNYQALPDSKSLRSENQDLMYWSFFEILVCTHS